MAQVHVTEQVPTRPEHVHPMLYAWRASLLSVIGREATQLGGDHELALARVEVLAVLDRHIALLEDRCPSCGASELCECEIALA